MKNEELKKLKNEKIKRKRKEEAKKQRAKASRVFPAVTRLTVYRQCQVRRLCQLVGHSDGKGRKHDF